MLFLSIKVLAVWTKEHMDQVGRVTGLWDNYMSTMENHDMIISKQVQYKVLELKMPSSKSVELGRRC